MSQFPGCRVPPLSSSAYPQIDVAGAIALGEEATWGWNVGLKISVSFSKDIRTGCNPEHSSLLQMDSFPRQHALGGDIRKQITIWLFWTSKAPRERGSWLGRIASHASSEPGHSPCRR